MEPVRRVLAALGASLERPHPLVETIVAFERALRSTLGLASVRIVVGDGKLDVPPGAIARDLRLDGIVVGRVSCVPLAGTDTVEAAAVLSDLEIPLALAIAWHERDDDRERLTRLARTDALTGLANRLGFDERFESAWVRCREFSTPLGVALLDIDFFKSYNDAYGHTLGDRCLIEVAALLARWGRTERAFVGRYGGEEFGVIFEDSMPENVARALDTLLAIFDQRPIPHAGSSLHRISLSGGLATTVPGARTARGDFIDEADRALYRAKLLGRNRICVGSRTTSGPIVSRSVSRLQPQPGPGPTIGRDADLARAIAGLRQSRLLTLVGPSGIGKSRLAADIATVSAASFPDGVAYLDLAQFGEDADPVAALCGTLEIVVGDENVLSSVCAALRDRTALVIFDNIVVDGFERHIAALCEELLSACPSLAIVATGRVRLGCANERAVVVPPLGDVASLDLLRERVGHSTMPSEPGSLAEIARALAGSPALIEAIAPFVRADGAQRVGSRLRALAGRSLVSADIDSLFASA
jgi:diguanylate cyclase (GGDEF)-like protein